MTGIEINNNFVSEPCFNNYSQTLPVPVITLVRPHRGDSLSVFVFSLIVSSQWTSSNCAKRDSVYNAYPKVVYVYIEFVCYTLFCWIIAYFRQLF